MVATTQMLILREQKWVTQPRGKASSSLHEVVELTCTRKMHMALPECSGIPKQGTLCIGPKVQNCHLSHTRRGWEKELGPTVT